MEKIAGRLLRGGFDFLRTKIVCLLALGALFTGGNASANTVTVDAVALSMTATPPLQMLTKPVWKGRELSFVYYSDAFSPFKTTLKVSGLTGPEYDVYSSGDFVGSWSGSQLETGVVVPIGAGIIDADIRMILRAMELPMKNAANVMNAAQQKYTLWPEYDGLYKWISRLLVQDRSGRQANIMVTEKGLPTSLRPPIDLTSDDLVKKRSLDLVSDLERLRRVVMENKFAAPLQAEYLGYLAPINVVTTKSSTGQTIVTISNLYDQLFWAEVKLLNDGKPVSGASICKVHIDSGLAQTCKFSGDIPQTSEISIKGKYGPYHFTASYPIAGFK